MFAFIWSCMAIAIMGALGGLFIVFAVLVFLGLVGVSGFIWYLLKQSLIEKGYIKK